MKEYSGLLITVEGIDGSGKSTILKLITRILEPTSGSITVDGKVTTVDGIVDAIKLETDKIVDRTV